MGRLTKAQGGWLAWCRDAGGITDITDKRFASRLLKRGLVSYDTFQDTWRITEAGRRALDGQTEPGEPT